MGVVEFDEPPLALDEASGEIHIILERPFFPVRGVAVIVDEAPAASSPRGRLATSEKKNDVHMVGVRGVRGTPPGVLSMDAYPPGLNNPVGDCNHANTFDVSKDSPEMTFFP